MTLLNLLKSLIASTIVLSVLPAAAFRLSEDGQSRRGVYLFPHEVCDDLRSRPKAELNALFSAGRTDVIPTTDTIGCPIANLTLPSEGLANLLTGPLSKFMNMIWTGKAFNQDGTALINKVLRKRIATADVRRELSIVDGKPVVVIDYHNSDANIPGTRWLIRRIRDEFRAIAPGLYLGRAFVELHRVNGTGAMRYQDPGLYFVLMTPDSGLLFPAE